MKVPDRHQLLHGPYEAPPLRRGDRVTCELRGDAIITSMSDGRISWPRCRGIGRRGGSGLLLAGGLDHAVRHEAAAAVGFWWGVGVDVIWRWRKALDVTRINNEGTQQLIHAAAEAGADAVKAKEWTEAELAAIRHRSKQLNTAQHLQTGYHGPLWKAEDLTLLGTLPDDEVARLIERPVNAVRVMRVKLGLPNPESPAWTDEELALLETLPVPEVVRRTGRSNSAVYKKRWKLRQRREG